MLDSPDGRRVRAEVSGGQARDMSGNTDLQEANKVVNGGF